MACRVTKDEYRRIKAAAGIRRHRSESDFMRQALVQAADAIIAETNGSAGG